MPTASILFKQSPGIFTGAYSIYASHHPFYLNVKQIERAVLLNLIRCFYEALFYGCWNVFCLFNKERIASRYPLLNLNLITIKWLGYFRVSTMAYYNRYLTTPFYLHPTY